MLHFFKTWRQSERFPSASQHIRRHCQTRELCSLDSGQHLRISERSEGWGYRLGRKNHESWVWSFGQSEKQETSESSTDAASSLLAFSGAKIASWHAWVLSVFNALLPVVSGAPSPFRFFSRVSPFCLSSSFKASLTFAWACRTCLQDKASERKHGQLSNHKY